ncbi:MAG: hypothetical protein CMB02_02820 [Euryarchaeota archaeon]|nr:hypothetical protein [Euryarchaeota archaeon]
MEVLNRKENPLLDRVELTFQWDHPNEPTPSLSKMIIAALKAEPGSKKELVFVKNVNTRFGMSRTSGLALVYGSEASASIEPEYVLERHKSVGSKSEENAEQREALAAKTDEPEESENEGGEE